MVTDKPNTGKNSEKKWAIGIAVIAILIVALWLLYSSFGGRIAAPDAPGTPVGPGGRPGPSQEEGSSERTPSRPEGNNPPVIQQLDTIELPVGVPFAWDLQASDPDGDLITFSLFPTEAPVTLDAAGHLSFLAKQPGTYIIRIGASDGLEQTVMTIQFIVN
ncbi:MAG TPA: Ig-like domain-containing protein [Candidatus Nanoarchaeia archaeon]|nr:Ig-like domain-containing protein [Candidatus Nanoarchaeia archaeon]